ncbi:MAG: PhzF family phenazine biosynthesis protein [Alphaproteobacteria bacterium]|nr:PhzF family phenazine biosynthesis protein [Alphaproteobacteria bacterium]
MKLKLWQVDAFARHALEGNPAAVVPLEAWIDAALMQKIADENNLAETAFFVRTGPGRYDLRWFTPEAEVDLCGHATLGSAWTIFEYLDPGLASVSFLTRSGELTVTRTANGLSMSLPSDMPATYDAPAGLAKAIGEALDVPMPKELHKARYLLALWDEAKVIRGIKRIDVGRVLRDAGFWGLVVTAKGDEGYDFVSRFFAPDKGVPEDPVTGSAHCILTPFWARRLGKKTLKARQVSPRGGDLVCTDDGARTTLEGTCAPYMTGEISV